MYELVLMNSAMYPGLPLRNIDNKGSLVNATKNTQVRWIKKHRQSTVQKY